MEELYLWVLISIALGGAGTFIAVMEALKQRRRQLEIIPYDTIDSILEGEIKPREEYLRKTRVYLYFPFTGMMFCLVAANLVRLNNGAYSPVQEKVAMGGFLTLGLSVFFANIGRSLFYKEMMEGLNEYGKGSPALFGRYIVLLSLPDTTMVYGFLVLVLGFLFSGILSGNSAPFDMGAADMYMTGCITLGLSASSAILMGIFFKRSKPLYEDVNYYGKKMVQLVIPHFINVLGLLAAILALVFSGMMVPS